MDMQTKQAKKGVGPGGVSPGPCDNMTHKESVDDIFKEGVESGFNPLLRGGRRQTPPLQWTAMVLVLS